MCDERRMKNEDPVPQDSEQTDPLDVAHCMLVCVRVCLSVQAVTPLCGRDPSDLLSSVRCWLAMGLRREI